jgi:thiol-disulfide isomerase/thioredoxin
VKNVWTKNILELGQAVWQITSIMQSLIDIFCHFIVNTLNKSQNIKNMKHFFLLFLILSGISANSQTLLTEAVDFHVKTIEGTPIFLFPLLDDDDMIVVIDFFSTTCGPCQDYAPDFQQSYEDFGENTSNVYFMGINWGNDNEGVREFDSVFGLTYPTASGVQGGGNIVFNDYQIQSYPTVIVVKPDHQISNQYVWLPTTENINQAVIDAGGVMVGNKENLDRKLNVFPNPAGDRVNIEFSDITQDEIYLDIISSGGQIVYQDVARLGNNNSISIDIHDFEKGIYFVRVISSEGKMETMRLLVGI